MHEHEETLLVRGRWLFVGGETPEKVIRDGALAIRDGVIVDIGNWGHLRRQFPAARVLGSDRHAILPGLINAHHHSSGASHIQHGIPDLLLEPWLLSLARRRQEDSFPATQLAAARLLRSGVTSVVDVHSARGDPDAFAASIEQPLRAYEEIGIRVAFGVGMMEQNHLVLGDDESFLASLPGEVRALARKRLPEPGATSVDEYFSIFSDCRQRYSRHPRIKLWFAPSGPQWVSEDFLVRIVEAAGHYDTRVQIHLEESVYERQYGLRTYGVPTVVYLHKLGVLGPRFTVAHGVWLTEQEIELLAASGVAVSHNPSSNLRLRAGIAPLNAMLAAGVSVGLGMDGTTMNDNDDIWQEMRLALRLHRTPRLNSPAPAAAEIFHLATHGSAVLMGAAGNLGALAVGYQADVVLVDLTRVISPWVAPEADPLTLTLYRASARDVDTVLIAGEVVVQDGRVLTIDEKSVAQEFAAGVARQGYPVEENALVEALTPHIEKYYEQWEFEPFDPYISYNSRT